MRNMPKNVNPELQMVMNKIAQANNANKVSKKNLLRKENLLQIYFKKF